MRRVSRTGAPRFRRCWMVLAVGTAGVAACTDSPSGVAGEAPGYFALQPVFGSPVASGHFALGIDTVGLQVRRPATGELVADTLVGFDPDSTTLHLTLPIAMVRPVEQFEARLTLQDGSLVLFAGDKVVRVRQGPPGTNAADTIHVFYEGPGRSIAQLVVRPSDTVLTWGDSTRFSVSATDSGGSAVERFFVSWSASDATLGRLDAFGKLRAPSVRDVITVSALTPNGVSAAARVTFIPRPRWIVLVGVDSALGAVGTLVPLVARVLGADSLGVRGLPVHFAAVTPGGRVADTVAITDSLGRVVTQLVVGDTVRDYGYEARVDTLRPVRRTVRGTAGPPAAVNVVAGDVQIGQVGAELPGALAVRVLDAHGNPVSGQRVNFVVTAGGGGVYGGSSNTSDAGIAYERWTLGTTAGAQRLEARAVDNTTGAALRFATFSATAVPGPADSLYKVVGDGQRATAGTALPDSLVVAVTDRYGNRVGGTPVQWGADAGSVSPASGVSNAQGLVKGQWLLGTVTGSYAATATATGLPSVRFAATAETGAPASITVSPPTTTLSALGATIQLEGLVHDAFGNVVADPSITWSSGDTSVAVVDATGRVTARHNGTVRVTASVSHAVTDFTDLTVAQAITTVQLTPQQTTLDAIGASVQLQLEASDANGFQVTDASVAWTSSDETVARVSGAGLVTAVGPGAAIITATVGGNMVQAVALTVGVSVDPAVARVVIAPAAGALTALGQTLALSATAMDGNGAIISGVPLTWATSSPAVATVDGGGLVTAVGNGTATISAAAAGVSGTATVTVAQTATSVAVEPAGVTFSALKVTQQLTATARDANGAVVPGAVVSWASGNDAVAVVSAAGLVTAEANGETQMTATVDGVSGMARVTVSQTVATVTVGPNTVQLTAVGATRQLTASLADENGYPVSSPVAWASSNGAVATVSANGFVSAVGDGTATITATSGAASASVTVVVRLPLPGPLHVVIDIKPGFAANTINLGSEGVTPVAILTTSLAKGEPLTFDAATVVVSSVRFAGGAPTHAALEDVDGDGDLDLILQFDTQQLDLTEANTAASLTGQTTDGRTFVGEDGITIVAAGSAAPAAVVTAVTVSPASVTLSAIGAQLQLAATATDAAGDPFGDPATTWETSNSAVVSVDATGLVTAVGNGSATITAGVDGVSGTADVVVQQVVTSLSVTPASVELDALGASATLSATAWDAGGHPVVGAMSWAGSDEGVVAVAGNGAVTAVGNGTATITASLGGISGSAGVTVLQVATSLTLSPHAVTLDALGAATQLTFSLTDANGHSVAGVPTWATSNPAVAGVNGSGLVTAHENGTATIRAAFGALSDAATVAVQQVARSVAVSPPSVALLVGGTVQFAASAADANGSLIADAACSWSSSDEAVARVDASGLVTAVAAGGATVTASCDGARANASVNVAAPSPESPPPEPIPVRIEVKVGADDSSRPINVRAYGVVPVAVLGSSTFDARDADVATVTFASAPAVHSALEDVNGDGRPDLILHFDTHQLDLVSTSTTAVLRGRTRSGQAFEGSQAVRILP